ncbi:hypothetical protein EON68_03170, partial [archaeon]
MTGRLAALTALAACLAPAVSTSPTKFAPPLEALPAARARAGAAAALSHGVTPLEAHPDWLASRSRSAPLPELRTPAPVYG